MYSLIHYEICQSPIPISSLHYSFFFAKIYKKLTNFIFFNTYFYFLNKIVFSYNYSVVY